MYVLETKTIRFVVNEVSKLTTTNGACSEAQEIAGLSWELFVRQYDDDGINELFIAVACNRKCASELWQCYAAFEVRLISPSADKPNLSDKNKCKFTWSDFMWGLTPISWQKMLDEGYAVNDSITVEATLTVDEVRGVRKNTMLDFTQPTAGADGVLVVEEARLHISKGLLAAHSPYFNTLFFADFKERKQEEIVLKDVSLEAFEGLLQLLYSKKRVINSLFSCVLKKYNVAEDNVETLLAVADRFDAEMATEQCEDWLREATGIDLEKKIVLADKFNLPLLKAMALDAIDSLPTLEAIRRGDHFKGFSPDTLIQLFDRALELEASTAPTPP